MISVEQALEKILSNVSVLESDRKPILVLAKYLGYGDTLRLMPQIEEVSKLLEAYTSSILDSGS